MTRSRLPWVTTALLGIVAGHFYSLEVGTVRVLDELDDAEYLRFKTAMDRRYRRFVGPLWSAALLSGAAALLRSRRALPPALSAAVGLNSAAFALLLTVNEPINRKHERIIAGKPTAGDPATLRRRWNAAQTARSWLVGAAFVLQLVGSTSRR